jgi:hypothetical protein
MNSAELQTELTLFAEDHAATVAAVLKRAIGWLSASDLLGLLALPDTESNRRLLRKCVEELGDETISGQQGYKHIDNATADEVRHFYNWMHSQGSKMVRRAANTLARKGLAEK